MAAARLALILHAHLPYVRHVERDDVLEEAWLVGALVESYLPLLDVLEGWERDRVPYALALSLSPTLVEMLDDPLLRERARRRLEGVIGVLDRELADGAAEPALVPALEHHRERFRAAAQRYRDIDGDVAGACAALARRGELELFTTAATHAFLPNLAGLVAAQRAQIGLGLEQHARRFGAPARGFWLPECGYLEELDPLLRELGVGWSVLDAHALAAAVPPPVRGPYAPVLTPHGVAMLARDPESSDAVWSAESGYPGDGAYREFHRDLGHTRDLRPFLPALHPDGSGWPTGIKPYAVTDRASDRKIPYDPERAARRAEEHARQFLDGRRRRGAELAPQLGAPALFVAPFDAELFGHWWFEGPRFLDAVTRAAAEPASGVALVTPRQLLVTEPLLQVVAPSPSSWGAGGHRASWIDPRNAWVVREVRDAAERMAALVRDHGTGASPWMRRALAQAGREALLAMASDWSFILRAETVSSYAEGRVREHLARFAALAGQIVSGAVDVDALAACEREDPIFGSFDPRWFG